MKCPSCNAEMEAGEFAVRRGTAATLTTAADLLRKLEKQFLYFTKQDGKEPVQLMGLGSAGKKGYYCRQCHSVMIINAAYETPPEKTPYEY